MTTSAKMPSPNSSNPNGILTTAPKGAVGGNRKKQKRRAKQAARQAAPTSPPPDGGEDAGLRYDEDALGYDEGDYEDPSEDDLEHEQYNNQFGLHMDTNGMHPEAATGRKKNKKKKAASVVGGPGHGAYDPAMLPSIPPLPHFAGALRTGPKMPRGSRNIWNVSTQQERANIKQFWLGLSEEQRKSLLKIEKEAVLKKMKQQQKTSCSCTVCGRKRTAIEEELEVLYEGYYEELEQYAHHDTPPLPSTDGMMPDPLHHRRLTHPLATPPPPLLQQNKSSHMQEHLDDDEPYSDEDEEEFSDEEDYSEDELDPEPDSGRQHRAPQGVTDFLNFGANLTVKDNLLTVADDLLKNDGRKFIEMMEQLAERRMQRENRSQYDAENHPGYQQDDPAYNHEDQLTGGDEYDDDEASYDSVEDYDDDLEEEEEIVGNLQMEGRRMFQIFAARMFEQRVLTAYREKIAKERQDQLLQDLVNEEEREKAKEAKKQRDAQKKKDKKKQQQLAKAEEKAKRDAEKAEEEARLREVEEQKLEEQRRKKDEQRKKREEEKRKQEEEKARKEADRLRRQHEEQQRREEAERKAREQKAAEKARKEEARKREREEREVREKEARDRKAQEEKERKEREAKAREARESKERDKASQHGTSHQHPQITKRPSQMGIVAVPGVYPKQTPGSGISSPRPSNPAPVLPKSTTPAVKTRQVSQQNSHSSSPKQSQSQLSSNPSKSSSPGSMAPQQIQPKTILQKPSNQHHNQHAQHPVQPTSPMHHGQIQPPPGMPHPHHNQHPGVFGGMTPLGFPGFPGPGMMHNHLGQRGQMPMFPPQGPPMVMPNRMFSPGMNNMSGPPQNMMLGPARPYAPGFVPFTAGVDASGDNQPPPGFSQPSHQPNNTSSIGPHPPGPPGLLGNEAPRGRNLAHSRQQSTNEKDRLESGASQPIARPAPIQRPSSVKPPQERQASPHEIDDLSRHLGSSALLDDDELPGTNENRRLSGAPAGTRNISGPPGLGQIGNLGGFGGPGSFGTPSSSWNTPNLHFGHGPSFGQPNWGSLPSPSGMNIGGWGGPASNGPPVAGPFGAPIHHPMHGPAAGAPHLPRPKAIRIAICQACRQLSNRGGGATDTDFHSMEAVMRQMEQLSRPGEPLPALGEILALCTTEGDSQNGGGELQIRKDPAAPHENAPASAYQVKWESDQPATDSFSFGSHANRNSGLGEIGSPMPSKTSPASVLAPSASRLPIGGIGRALGGFGGPGAPGQPVQGQHQGLFQYLGAVGESSH